MNNNPMLQGNTGDFLLPNQGLGQGETLSILGKIVESKKQVISESEAAKVNFAMIVIHAVSDIGIERFTNQLQDLGSFQDQVGFAQSAFGSIQAAFATFEKNSYWNGTHVQFSNSLKDSYGTISDFEKAVYGLFKNMPLTVPGGNYKAVNTPTWESIKIAIKKPGGGYVYIQPFNKNGSVNESSYNLVHKFIHSLNGYMFPPQSGAGTNIPNGSEMGNHMPIYIAMALSEMQVKLDNNPNYLVDAGGNFLPKYNGMFQNGTLFNNLFGSFNSDAPLEAIQNLATLLSTKTNDIGTLLSQILVTGYLNPPFDPKQMLQPFADLMADYMKNKYQGSPSGPSDPSGYLPGITGWTNQYDSISLFANLNTSVTQGSSELQTQTQENSANAQGDTAQINSYDQIGQSIVAGVNKAQKTMTQGQTVS